MTWADLAYLDFVENCEYFHPGFIEKITKARPALKKHYETVLKEPRVAAFLKERGPFADLWSPEFTRFVI